MPHSEKSAVTALATIMSFRMLGLFMLLPILSTYAGTLPGATPTLIGLALGIYGLTQACLQIPFGTLSDKIGRKPVIAIGMSIFVIGSIIAALSHGITGIIIGRAIQGAGAIGSTVLALVADLTRDENRSKAMATMGLTIGLAFMIAIVVGPMINAWWHLSGIFWTTAALALIGIAMLWLTVPNPPKVVVDSNVEAEPKRFRQILKNKQLLRLDLGIFCAHAMLTALFIAIPLVLTRTLNMSHSQQVWLYLSVLALAFILMLPLIIIGEKKRLLKPFFIGAVAALTLSQLLLILFHHSIAGVAIILLIFFTAFTLLEASLPSLVSKISPIRNKGSAMGIYSTAQFLGIFVGGALGGYLFQHFHVDGILVLGTILGTLWLIAAVTMKQPPYFSTLIFQFAHDAKQISQQLRSMDGIKEVAWMKDEALLYVKADKNIISEPELRKVIEQCNLA